MNFIVKKELLVPYIYSRKTFLKLTNGIDKRTRQFKRIKVEFAFFKLIYKAKSIQPLIYKISDPEYLIKKAENHYSWIAYEKQWEYFTLTEGALISYIRHAYTNYENFLNIMNNIDNLDQNHFKIYYYEIKDKLYYDFKIKINDLIENNFKETLEKIV